jgi:plasmid rolling circle replication initiator protein Rep
LLKQHRGVVGRIVSKNEPGVRVPVSEEPVVYLTDLSPKDQKWDYHRANTTVIGQHYDANPRFERLGDRMAGCTTWLGFAELVNRDSGEIGLKLRYANFCGVRHCPTCAWRRTLRNTARFFAAIPRLQERFPKHRWLFLTLTVKNCEPENLRETIKAMNAAWKRLIERANWPGEGWVKAVEVTRGEDGSAHPHFHVMVMVKPSYFTHGYIKHEEWAERWKSVMRLDYTPVVDVRVVKPKKEGQTIEAAVVETLKYATKVQDSLKSPEWLYIITEQLHKMRFVESGGALKGVLKEQFTDEELIAGDEPASDDEDSLDKGEEKIVGVSWNSSSKRYIRSTQGSYSGSKTRKPKQPLPDLPKPPAAVAVLVAKSYTPQEFATAAAAHAARVRSDAARSDAARSEKNRPNLAGSDSGGSSEVGGEAGTG